MFFFIFIIRFWFDRILFGLIEFFILFGLIEYFILLDRMFDSDKNISIILEIVVISFYCNVVIFSIVYFYKKRRNKKGMEEFSFYN